MDVSSGLYDRKCHHCLREVAAGVVPEDKKRGTDGGRSTCTLHCERVCSDSGRAFISRIPFASCSRIYPGIVYVLADAGDKISENRKFMNGMSKICADILFI